MTAAVVGAGPVGLVSALALAKRGHEVLLVDPEVGPGQDATWRRHGVMQFQHPHFFRHLVREVLEEHVPEMWDEVVAAGGVVNPPPAGFPPHITTLSCRRTTFEAALRRAALRHERVTFVAGYADSVLLEGDRVTGVVIDGVESAAELVLATTGRTSKFADDLRPEGEGAACGQSYVARMYRARPGVDPLVSFLPLGAQQTGYQTIVFPQDAGTLSALIVRASADTELSAVWRPECFEAAAALIPNLMPWTDPERFEPITEVMRGGTLTNTYRGQGTPPAGLYFLGDAVCTTNPSAGRGVSLGLKQVAAFLDALDAHPDAKDVSAALDAWCAHNVKPWYDDHVVWDASVVRRYAGEGIDVEAPLPSDVICAAVEHDPSLAPVIGPYQAMVALPSTLRPLEEQVRSLLRTGWRPQLAQGPDRDTLVERLRVLTAVPDLL